MQLAYELTGEKIEVLKKHSKFKEFATSKKKEKATDKADIAKSKAIQEKILKAVE